MKTKSHGSAANRIEVLSRHFLGNPYKTNPLIGSSDTPEVFTASLDGFDCVTYIETILALARASTADEFSKWLRKIRYEQGCVAWVRRNHYMTAWIRNNVKEGLVRRLPVPAKAALSRSRVLNVVPGLRPERIRVKCIPKPSIQRIEPSLHTGDLFFFASTRKISMSFIAASLCAMAKRSSCATPRAAAVLLWNRTSMNFSRRTAWPGSL